MKSYKFVLCYIVVAGDTRAECTWYPLHPPLSRWVESITTWDTQAAPTLTSLSTHPRAWVWVLLSRVMHLMWKQAWFGSPSTCVTVRTVSDSKSEPWEIPAQVSLGVPPAVFGWHRGVVLGALHLSSLSSPEASSVLSWALSQHCVCARLCAEPWG